MQQKQRHTGCTTFGLVHGNHLQFSPAVLKVQGSFALRVQVTAPPSVPLPFGLWLVVRNVVVYPLSSKDPGPYLPCAPGHYVTCDPPLPANMMLACNGTTASSRGTFSCTKSPTA